MARRLSAAGAALLLALLALSSAGLSALAADTTPPRIAKAQMVDADGDGKADRVVLTYTEPVNHTADTDGTYPFAVANYRITKVGAASASRRLTINLAEKTSPDPLAKPKVTYTRTTSAGRPVRDVAGNQAANQGWTWTFPRRAVYVATTGDDLNSGTSQGAPKKTIDAAVLRAGAIGARDVYVASGTYQESGGVDVADLMTITGKFKASNWFRASAATTITGAPQAVLADGDSAVRLRDLTLRSTTVAGTGLSSYGIRAYNASSLTLERVSIFPAAGTVGYSQGAQPNRNAAASGVAGSAGTAGGAGGAGGGGFNSAYAGGSGGAGGVHIGDGTSGGAGGGPAGGAGGPGGASGDCLTGGGDDGTGGGAGANGTSGAGGTGGAAGPAADGTAWNGSYGSYGANGNSGSAGGGGGGGGGGESSFFCAAARGGGGGGGGGGGYGGYGGVYGLPGGGSFGIYLHGSSITLLAGVLIATGDGGAGGNAGAGGQGGAGGSGGAGGTGAGSAGAGGSGGIGGNGGPGGAGGGGAGGPSIGVYKGGGSTASVGTAQISVGAGGAGGWSPAGAGSYGQTGISAAQYPPP
jgi:hypothetical protein